jgi:HB1, ASXL, restriction endonuclease HTH domain
MGLADIAEQVPREAGGGPLHYREITERATTAGLMTPTGDTPWASITQRWVSTTAGVSTG